MRLSKQSVVQVNSNTEHSTLSTEHWTLNRGAEMEQSLVHWVP